MPKEDKIRGKAQKALDKAELLFDQERYDKSAKEFTKAGEQYESVEEYKVAEQCYFYASKSFISLQKYLQGSNSMRSAANTCVLLDDYAKAADYYDISAKYALKSNRKKEAEFRSILSASFAYLCWFLKGKQDKGLAFIKRIKKNVDSKEFAENRLVRLVKGLTLAIINQNDDALQSIEEDFINYKFRPSETKLIKDALLLAKTHLLLEYSLEIPEKEVTHEDIIEYSLKINVEELKELENDAYLKHQFKSMRVIDCGITHSDNISLKEKEELPFEINANEVELKFTARANFPGDAYLGPLVFTLELDEKLYFFAKTKKHKMNIKSPPAQLGINLKPLTNPIINQTFPMEISINNPSDADAVKIDLEFEFPKSLRLMRGTTKKKIFQLIRNEDFNWQISLKPLEPGNHVIKVTMTFFDQDGNQIGPNSADLPFEINL